MKKIISVLIIAVLLFSVCGTAFATTWSGGHDTGDSDLTIAPGDILDNSFGVHGVVSVSGGYNCFGWADWGVGWGSAHKSFYVETVDYGVMYNKPHLILSGYYFSTDEYTDDDCHYGDSVYSWTDDTCTATVVCTRDASHTVTETLTGTYCKDKDADCESSEVGHYEAVFTKEYFTSSASEAFTIGDPAGHDWGEPEYTWEGDQCTETIVCGNDETHVQTKTETGKYVIDTEADCENPEIGYYEAYDGIVSEAFTTGDALGHDWGEPEYTWEGDRCTETIVCGNDETHVQTKTETGTYVKETEADCENPEIGHYEAFDGIVSEAVTIGDPIGHDWGEPEYAWEGDQCTETIVCGNDETHVQTKTETGKYVIDTEADCENPEVGHYEAFDGIASEAFTTGEALGHDWGEPEYTWDGDRCTETIVCGNDGTHVQTKTETGKYVIDREANCEQPEKGHYEAFDGIASEAFEQGEALGHVFGGWKTVWEATASEAGLEKRFCDVCGTSESRTIARIPMTSYLSLDGAMVKQVLTEEEDTETEEKILVIAPAEDEELKDFDLITAAFTAEDVKGFVDKGYVKVIIKSACDTVEVVFAPDELAEILETAQCVKAEFLLSDRAEIDDKAEFDVPEGMTPNSGFHDIIFLMYDKDGNEGEPDKEQLKNIKIRIYDAEPLTDVNNDIVGLYSEELPEFVEVSAEYFYEEDKEIGYWELPLQGNGVYRTAEKLPAAE